MSNGIWISNAEKLNFKTFVKFSFFSKKQQHVEKIAVPESKPLSVEEGVDVVEASYGSCSRNPDSSMLS